VALTVVGSIAFDSVRTPFGERDRMLGGSAVHFALAARFFTEARIVGPVGDDFDDEYLELLSERGIDVSDVERVEGGKTFVWAGHYEADMNLAHTDDTQLGVFADFDPKLSRRLEHVTLPFVGVTPSQEEIHDAQVVGFSGPAVELHDFFSVEGFGNVARPPPGPGPIDIPEGKNAQEIDRLIRRYGYLNTPQVLDAVRRDPELAANLGAAAHLIHGSSEGRFRITYCTAHLSKEEIEGAQYSFMPVDAALKKYDPAKLRDGYQTACGEEIFYISNPGLGLWAHPSRFEDKS
jgi:hypothetical protein